MLIYVLYFLLCYVEISEKYLFTVIYVLYHKNETRSFITDLRHSSLKKDVLYDFLNFDIWVQSSK